RSNRLSIEEITWGRLVDVYALDDVMTGDVEASPRFRDFVIDESVVTNTVDFVLETNPATQRTSLVIQREYDDAISTPSFSDLLIQASSNLPIFSEKADDGTSVGPFSQMPRNACLVIRTNDLLDDGQEAIDDLASTVQVKTSYPPQFPYEARLLFDPNHGDISSGEFHSTRVLVDMTISDIEAEDLGSLIAPNLLGLPSSLVVSGDPNVSIRIPTVEDFSIGQFSLLRNLRGKEMDNTDNGPTANNSTLDVVRAFRSGNSADLNNGFLFDTQRPEVVGAFSLVVDSAINDVSGEAGFDFLLDITYQTVCQSAIFAGDVLEIGNGQFLEVTEDGIAPVGSVAAGIRARLLTSSPLLTVSDLVGAGLRRTPYDPFDVVIESSCWLSFLPVPASYPPVDILPGTQVQVRFSEPMDPDTVSAYETLQVFRSGGAANPAVDTVAGVQSPSTDLRTFSFIPSLPYAHSGDSRSYDVVMLAGLEGVRDLAGNTVVAGIDPTSFSIDPTSPQSETAALTLRFNDSDEYQEGAASGAPDFRGTVFPDFDRGVVRPRSPARSSFTVDRANLNTIPAGYAQLGTPLFTPLNPMGSKLQAVWRYMDFGFLLDDESKIDLAVEGLNWVPFVTSLQADVFERFEIALASSSRAPDLTFTVGMMGAPDVLNFPNSGLFDAPTVFDSNLQGGTNGQEVVHNRGLGYLIDPTSQFTATNNVSMVPYPLNNVAGPLSLFEWRDTSDHSVGGAESGGVPTSHEIGFYSSPNGYNGSPAYTYNGGSVPTIGLPLLMEFRCFPSDSALGLNSVMGIIALPNGSALAAGNLRPFFRAFADGGRDQFGAEVRLDPDLQDVPTGGFNPLSLPPGLVTPSADNVFYPGQLDTVITTSRLHTMYLDSEFSSPDYLPASAEPGPSIQPAGTGLVFEYRGATSFTATGNAEFDTSTMDPYGDPTNGGGTVNYFSGTSAFSLDVNDFDGAAFLQIQVTFINNVTSGQSPELSTLVLPYGEL
ncbi:MAG: hypothetical protein ACI9K5_001956, partial [Gammaproteobacteria bacterium]